MNRTAKAFGLSIIVLAGTFIAIGVCQNLGGSLKIDVTQRKLYTLSKGTAAILDRLDQPVTVKLYYAAKAARKGPDQIRYFGNYYRFVRSLLEEYVAAANGMIDLQIIDPRPFSEDEAHALRYGLQRFPITEEENFFFGLVALTESETEASIPFFSPDRQSFVEYDISRLIDNSITLSRERVGIISSLPVMGDDPDGHVAQLMRMQGQTPRQAWGVVEQLKGKYDVKQIDADSEEIKDVDILIIIHPKELPEKTLFAIDQFVLKSGRAIVCVDPHCFADMPERSAMQTGGAPSQRSSLNILMRTWGIEMEEESFAGDRNLALKASIRQDQRPETMIGFLGLTPGCFNKDQTITAYLQQARLLFPGVLKEISLGTDNNIDRTPLVMTTSSGNSWSAGNPYELITLNPTELMMNFSDGTETVNMGYLITGRFKSSFPNGIEIEATSGEDVPSTANGDGTRTPKPARKVTGVKASEVDGAVAVFADVDFLSDMIAYQDTFLGKIAVGDNAAMLLNAVDELSGSSDLISIRSRGNFRRPFVVVDNIEKIAERETAHEEAMINAEIARFQDELQTVIASSAEGGDVIEGTILKKTNELEVKIREAQMELRSVKMKRRERIESLGSLLQNFNTLMMPAFILATAIFLGVSRSMRLKQ